MHYACRLQPTQTQTQSQPKLTPLTLCCLEKLQKKAAATAAGLKRNGQTEHHA